jgi:tripartite-type tricarboxylate transporter receptor subunit TctC
MSEERTCKCVVGRRDGAAVAGTPNEFAAYIRDEIAKWAKVIKLSGARAD